MSSSNDISELASKIQQFISYQMANNSSLSEASKESLTVATECIERAFDIQTRPASNELLDLYRAHKTNPQSSNTSSAAPGGLGDAANPAALLQNLASTFLGAAGSGLMGGQSNPTAAPSAPPAETAPSATPSAPKVRKSVSPAEKMAAESFKNQGNDYMKQDLFKEAYDCYTKAIDIDNNNAIYYSNRAAASSKMGDHAAALRDCEEAVEIDSTYSKAWGRMALAHASLDNHHKAKESYLKAVELDPINESYRNNLRIAEEKIAEMQAGGGSGSGGEQGNVVHMLRNMMTNPNVMQMALRSLQDPRMQNLLGLNAQAGGQAGSTAAPQNNNQQQQQQSNPTTTASAPNESRNQPTQQQQTAPETGNTGNTPPTTGLNPADLFNLTSRIAGGAGNIDLVGAGQQLLSSMQQNNPEFVENMRRMMNQAFTPPNNQNDSNPPPGYS